MTTAIEQPVRCRHFTTLLFWFYASQLLQISTTMEGWSSPKRRVWASLLYQVYAVASRNKWFTSCGTSGKLTLWTPSYYSVMLFQRRLLTTSKAENRLCLRMDGHDLHDYDGEMIPGRNFIYFPDIFLIVISRWVNYYQWIGPIYLNDLRITYSKYLMPWCY